jgi:hypothetical protein
MEKTTMAGPPKPQDAARRAAQTHFTQSEQRDKAIKQEIEKERAASAAKTARLRALRLAKEASERNEAEKAGAAAPKAAQPTPRRKRISHP